VFTEEYGKFSRISTVKIKTRKPKQKTAAEMASLVCRQPDTLLSEKTSGFKSFSIEAEIPGSAALYFYKDAKLYD